MAALRVADLAVFVVSAVEGVEVQTELMWKAAAKLGLPRLIFVNKLDRERASFSRTLEQLQQTFGAGIAPLELPIGEEASFVGVADLLSDTAITYEGGKPTTGAIPDEMEAQEHEVHESLIEGIVVGDDDLMERYLEGDVPDFKELEETLAQGVASAQVFPVLCGSAAKDIAIDRLATFICEIGPSPLDRPGSRGAGRRPGTRGQARSGRPAAGRGVQDPGRPLRRQDLPVQGAVRHHPPRRHTDQPPDPLRREAARPVHPAGQGTGPGQRGARRRPGGGRQARRRHDRRHPGAPRHPGRGSPPGDGARRSSPSPSARSPRATRTS